MGMEQYRMRMHHVGIVLPTIEAAKRSNGHHRRRG